MKKPFKCLIVLLIIIGVMVSATGIALWYLWSSNLPYIGTLKDYDPPTISVVYSSDGKIIGRFWEEKRIVVPLKQIPKHVIYAFVAAEDSRFFEHRGIDVVGIFRALIKNITAGKIEQGGSTITQQVTRSLLLKNTKRTYRRKAREALLSLQIEKNFSKDRILFLYLNQIYLGHGAYGVEAAAQTYFGKSAKDLDIAEAALLAGLPQAPARYSPVTHFAKAKARQRYVLQRMRQEGYITKRQEVEAYREPLKIIGKEEDYFQRAPYFTEYVRQYLVKKYGKDRVYRGGLRVYTTVNLAMQKAAQEALRKGLEELDKREGYRGPLRHINEEDFTLYKEEVLQSKEKPELALGSKVKALVEKVDDSRQRAELWVHGVKAILPLVEMKWARKPDPKMPYYRAGIKKVSETLSPGDVILVRIKKKAKTPFSWIVALEQDPQVQGALICMEPQTGKVRAMVGGRNFSVSQFNRAVQARRQPGSAFKPIIYSAALDKGMSPADVIVDAPFISDKGEDEKLWKPRNYKGRFFGPTILRTALSKSRNVITVKILKKIGIDYVISYARQLGITSPLNEDLSLALGSSGVSLLELTRAYCVFASLGFLPEPIFVEKILDRKGRVIEENQPQSEQVISPQTAYVMTDLLKAVVQEGTGWRVKALHRPVAGKTGTTNDLRDAWFMGFTPQVVTGVWVGYDDRTPMGKGETGSRAASPIWLYFMRQILKDMPVEDFSVPDGVVFAKIDAKTGLLASPYSKKTVFQAFREGTEPKEYTPKPAAPKTGQFLLYDMDGGS